MSSLVHNSFVYKHNGKVDNLITKPRSNWTIYRPRPLAYLNSLWDK